GRVTGWSALARRGSGSRAPGPLPPPTRRRATGTTGRRRAGRRSASRTPCSAAARCDPRRARASTAPRRPRRPAAAAGTTSWRGRRRRSWLPPEDQRALLGERAAVAVHEGDVVALDLTRAGAPHDLTRALDDQRHAAAEPRLAEGQHAAVRVERE